jgi:predicted RNA-binding protein associated with RNAse of E/G family
VILVRYCRGSQVREVRPVTVIEDGPDGLAVWLAPQTPMIRSVLADGRSVASAPLQERFVTPVVRRERTWNGTGIVMVFPPGAPYSVWLFWDAERRFLGWYGNLEDEAVRWPGGLDTADLHLDVWVTPDRECEWRDEDEFDVAIGLPGFWTAHRVPRIREAGERIMALARAGHPPFDGRFVDFTPDPSWPVPTLPDNWDTPRHGA